MDDKERIRLSFLEQECGEGSSALLFESKWDHIVVDVCIPERNGKIQLFVAFHKGTKEWMSESRFLDENEQTHELDEVKKQKLQKRLIEVLSEHPKSRLHLLMQEPKKNIKRFE